MVKSVPSMLGHQSHLVSHTRSLMSHNNNNNNNNNNDNDNNPKKKRRAL